MNNRRELDAKAFHWLRFPLPIYNREALRCLLSRRLANGQFFLDWDGTRLTPVFWQKRTAEREAEGDVEFGKSFAECLSNAAEYLGISYSTLHRLVRPRVRTGGQREDGISAATFFRIRTARHHPNSDAFRRELDAAVMGPAGRVMREYLAYIERELARYANKRSSKHDIAPAKQGKEGKLRKEWLARQEFWAKAEKLGVPATRARLADLRTYDPIVAWHRMRHAREFSKTEQSRIVRLGYRREERLVRTELRTLRAAIAAAVRDGRRH